MGVRGRGPFRLTSVRPALERLRDLVAGVGIDVVLCYAPDRLARKFAYQAVLLQEFARAGTGWSSSRAARRSAGGSAAGVVPGHVRRVREGPDHGALPTRQGAPRPHRVDQRALGRPVRLPLRPQERSRRRRLRGRRARGRAGGRTGFVATPTTGPPSRTWRAGSPARTCRLAPASIAGTGR